jgi:hypothetical protein
MTGSCSGHVTGIAFGTTLDQDYLTYYGYREVTITDAFPTHLQTNIATNTSPRPSTNNPSSVKSTSLGGPSSIPSGILRSFSASLPMGTATSSSAVVSSKSNSAAAPSMVTGAMRIMAAAAVVGGAVVL